MWNERLNKPDNIHTINTFNQGIYNQTQYKIQSIFGGITKDWNAFLDR